MSLSLPANAAQKVKVSALTPFNSLTPAPQMKVITLERADRGCAESVPLPVQGSQVLTLPEIRDRTVILKARIPSLPDLS